ncbi:YheE family protein [Bacillus pinisoli]|uniref:YheE family protein n=1 Tax=Bacillus pinisoli TaxID=2901866 RepID=UPI001FF4664A|nr:YheE family protein [Bacillus pinisoli]
MLSHFTYKPLFKDQSLPGWMIRFYFKGNFYEATYQKDGTILWKDATPSADDLEKVISQIHELMLYHVYDS